jgi:hypothetical protein
MFCNEVTTTGMQASSKEAAHEEIDEWAQAKGLDKNIVKNELGDDIDQVPTRQRLDAHKGRSESIEEDLECPAIRRFAFTRGYRVKPWKTHAKNTLPKTLFKNSSSNRVGKSVSIPS